MIRPEFGWSISKFVELVGVPRRTYHACLAHHRAGNAAKGPWPASKVDRIEPAVAKLAGEFAAWGHRKPWAMSRFEGWAVRISLHQTESRPEQDLLIQDTRRGSGGRLEFPSDTPDKQ